VRVDKSSSIIDDIPIQLIFDIILVQDMLYYKWNIIRLKRRISIRFYYYYVFKFSHIIDTSRVLRIAYLFDRTNILYVFTIVYFYATSKTST